LAKQSKQQYLGHVGETEVLRQLLDIGASINSLSASDFGWDLHVHLPEKAMVIGDLTEKSDGLEKVALADLTTWEMSGYTANIQVKKQTSDWIPEVSVGTLRGWLTGSRVGVPTFVVIVKGERLTYLSPHALLGLQHEAAQQYLDDEDKIELSDGVEVSKSQLSLLLYIWTRHPQIMLAGGFDDILAFPTHERKGRAQEQAAALASNLALAWLKDHDQSGIDNQETLIRTCEQFGSLAYSQLNPDVENHSQESLDFSLEVGQDIVDQRGVDTGYSDNEYGKIYTRSADPTASGNDAAKIIEEVCTLMRELSS
jgi:hypothetical protein